MPPKTRAQESFELQTLTRGLDYSRNELGSYSDFNTGIVYGSFYLGWVAGWCDAMEKQAQNA
jgi:hypothetical protein